MNTAEALNVLLSLVRHPFAETNTPQLSALLNKPYPCPQVPAMYTCGADGTCSETTCPAPRFRYARLPLTPLPGGYNSASKLYTHVARWISSIFASAGGLVLDMYFPLSSLLCRPRLGCRRQKPMYKKLTGQLMFDTYMPRIIVPTLLHYRVLRIPPEPKRLHMTAPWMIVKEVARCTTLLCASDKCMFSITLEGVEAYEGTVLYHRGRTCGKPVAILHSIGAILENEESLERDQNPGFYILGYAVPVHYVSDGSRDEFILWNPRGYPSRVTIIYSKHKILDAEERSPFGTDTLIPEYDRVTLTLRPYGVTVLRVTKKPLPRFLLAGGKKRI